MQILSGGGFIKLKSQQEKPPLIKVCTGHFLLLVHKSFQTRLEQAIRSKHIFQPLSDDEKKLLGNVQVRRDIRWWVDLLHSAGCTEAFISNWGCQLSMNTEILSSFAPHAQNKVDISCTLPSGFQNEFLLYKFRPRKYPATVRELLLGSNDLHDSVVPMMGHVAGTKAGRIYIPLRSSLCHGISYVSLYLVQHHVVRQLLPDSLSNLHEPPSSLEDRTRILRAAEKLLVRLSPESRDDIVGNARFTSNRMEIRISLKGYSSFDDWIADSPFSSADELTHPSAFFQKVLGVNFDDMFEEVRLDVGDWLQEVRFRLDYAKSEIGLFKKTNMPKILAQARTADVLGLLGHSNPHWRMWMNLRGAWDPKTTSQVLKCRLADRDQAWSWEEDKETKNLMRKFSKKQQKESTQPAIVRHEPPPEQTRFSEAVSHREKRAARYSNGLGRDLTPDSLQRIAQEVKQFAQIVITSNLLYRATYRSAAQSRKTWSRHGLADHRGRVLDPTKEHQPCNGGAMACGNTTEDGLALDVAELFGETWCIFP